MGQLRASSHLELEVSLPYSSSPSSSLLGQAYGTSSPGRSPKVVLVCSMHVSPLNSRGWGDTWSMSPTWPVSWHLVRF